jgi:integrase
MASYRISVRENKSASRPLAKWVIDIRHPNGKRERRYFLTKQHAESEAQAKRIEIQNMGVQALDLPLRVKVQALEAQDALKPYGASIADAVAFFLLHKRKTRIPVSEVAKCFEDSRVLLGRSHKHISTLRRFFVRFCTGMGNKAATDITPDEIDTWLHELNVGPVAINSYRTLLHSLFAYGVSKRMCSENPIHQVEKVTVKPGKVGILTVEHTQMLLENSADDVRATIALGAFAGIRPEEIVRLAWEDIDLEEGLIDIGAEKSKTARQRYVKILPNLNNWLRPLIGKGIIQQDNFRRRYDDARSKSGFAVRGKQRRLTEEQLKNLSPWPHDALRHSFASYHIAAFEDASALALQLGHESTSLIFSNYRHRVKQKNAVRSMGILPGDNDREINKWPEFAQTTDWGNRRTMDTSIEGAVFEAIARGWSCSLLDLLSATSFSTDSDPVFGVIGKINGEPVTFEHLTIIKRPGVK